MNITSRQILMRFFNAEKYYSAIVFLKEELLILLKQSVHREKYTGCITYRDSKEQF